MTEGNWCWCGLGLATEDPAWLSLLESEGATWQPCAQCAERETPAVLIVPDRAPFSARRLCASLVARGAAAVTERGKHLGHDRVEGAPWSFPYDNAQCRAVANPEEAPQLEVLRFRLGKGVVYSLPFRLADVWSDDRLDRQYVQIGSTPGQFLHERMGAIIRRNVRRVIKLVLKRAFHEADLPFVRKWYWPGRRRSVFCFRGDADGGPRENVTRFLQVVKEHADCVSIFFCTSRYERKKDLITTTARQGIEVGSHNHWHIVFPEPFTNALSVRLAERLLTRVAGKPRGFVAPAYFWHPSLYRTLQARGYRYASAFAVSHDDWPFRPIVDGRIADLVEIPTHCLGDRFVRFGIGLDSQVPREFFERLIQKKYAAGEPMILYGHPDTPGRMGSAPGLVGHIIETARSYSDVWAAQLHEVADWWNCRRNAHLSCWYDPDRGHLACGLADGGRWCDPRLTMSVEMPDGRFFLIPAADALGAGVRLDDYSPCAPLRTPKPTDVGEVVYKPSDPQHGPTIKQVIKRYAKAYAEAYLHDILG